MSDGPSVDPAVVVVLPAQRAGELLSRQLEALASQREVPRFEVVVVLDVDDPGVALVESFGDRLRLVTLSVPMRGAAAARNAGVAATRAPVVLFCDADDVVGPRWVRSMADEVGRTGLCGSPMRVEWEVCPTWARPIYQSNDVASVDLFHEVVPFVLSASMGIDRSLFDAVGGFDESFPGAGGEEVDLCLRVAALRGEEAPIGLVDDVDATVRYRPRSTFRSISRQRAGYSRGTALLVVKHDLGGIGTVSSIDRRRLWAMARSPRRLMVMARSFVALRWTLRARRSAKASSVR